MLDPTRWLGWVSRLGDEPRVALRWASHHTGLPVILVAAIVIVASWRLFKQSLRFALEVAFAAALLLGATKLGLLHW
ncbi:MAG: hypothetical protein M3O46_23520 [Myxococcota bacterium]|nr:hypothetical protein [Myxococcota bacterium]